MMGDNATIIDLAAMGGHQSQPSNAGQMRARTIGTHTSGITDAGFRPSSYSTQPQHSGLRMVFDDDHDNERKRSAARNQHQSGNEEPLVDEILNILPPELREYFVRLGNLIYPSLQIINVHTDLQEAGEEIIFNTPASKLRGLAAGLAFHLMAFAGSFMITLLVSFIDPTFFQFYHFWFFSFSAIFDYWKFFVWAGILASGVWYLKGGKTSLDSKTLGVRALNNIGVATLEELGYRWVYICIAMIALQSFNFVIHYAGLWVGVFFLVAALGAFLVAALFSARFFQRSARLQRFFAKFNPTHVMIGATVMVPVSLGLMTGGMIWMQVFDSVFDYLVVPATNVFSLWQYDDMLNGWFGLYAPPVDGWQGRARRDAWKASSPNRFFVYGMLLCNITFRDGHKYQGLVGWINSWYVGLMLLSAMVHHGWFTALAIHILYELQFLLIGYIFSHFKLARSSRSRYASFSNSALGGR